MKILGINMINEANSIDKELSKLGEYINIDWRRILKRNGRRRLYAHILDVNKKFKQDYVFMQIQQENIITPQIARQLHGYVINFTGDVRSPLPNWYKQVGREIDMTLFTNMHDVNEMRKAGIKADFLYIGFDESVFYPDGAKGNHPEIVFVGNNYGHRFPLSRFRHDMVCDLANTYGSRFGVYGNFWNKNIKAIPYHKEAECYRSAKICINLSQFNYERYASGRLVHILGAGGFCLSHHYKGVEQDFTQKHFRTWHSMAELKEQINYYLEHEEARKEIAETGCQYAHENFTWGKQLKKIIK